MATKDKILNTDELIRYVQIVLENGGQKKQYTPDLSWVMDDIKNLLVEETLVHTYGNQTKAANMLGINRGTIRTMIRAREEK